MSTSVESTVVMPASTEPQTASRAAGAAALEAESGSPPASASPPDSQGAEHTWHRSVSPNVVMSVLGGLIAALLSGMLALLVVQFSSLGNSIENLGTRIDNQGVELRAEIDNQGAELRAEIGALRAEMQAGFREVNATLLDHTERLVRLETAVGVAE